MVSGNVAELDVFFERLHFLQPEIARLHKL